MDGMGNMKSIYKTISFYAAYQVFSNIFAIICTAVVIYFIRDWFSGVPFYVVFIPIFCLFYFGIRIIFLTTIISKSALIMNNFITKRQFESAFESKDDMQYRKLLIQHALNKVKFGDANEKRLGIEQLEQFSEELAEFESKYIYNALLNILKSESEGAYAKIIIGILNKIQK